MFGKFRKETHARRDGFWDDKGWFSIQVLFSRATPLTTSLFFVSEHVVLVKDSASNSSMRVCCLGADVEY